MNLIKLKKLEESIIKDFEYSKIIFQNKEAFVKIHASDLNALHLIKERIKEHDLETRIIITTPIQIKENTFELPLNLSNCILKRSVEFLSCTFKDEFEANNCEFEDEVSFYNSTFEANARLQESKFRRTNNFENTTFKSLIDFYKSEFFYNQRFYHTDFLKISIFSNVTFHEQIQFLHNKISSETTISFEKAIFKKGLDISRANFWCNLQFWGVDLKVKNQISSLKLYQTDEIEKENIKRRENDAKNENINLKVKALEKLRETFRIIKNDFQSKGNKVESLEFNKKELKILQREVFKKTKILYLKHWIREKNSSISSILTTLKLIGENILLFFNRTSNDYGTKWGRAFLFTLIISIVFFYLFLLSIQESLFCEAICEINGKNQEALIQSWIQFLNLANWKFEPLGEVIKGWSYLVLFVSRLFIGYGYYQFIQAFRKYGKG